MKPSWNILHLSDFHIHDPGGNEELLRAEHYDEYLSDLADAIRVSHPSQIDSLVLTGDFVNCGRIANFDHAAKVVQCVADKFKLRQDAIVVCPGNHDIEEAKESDRTFREARAGYAKFAKQWANGRATKKTKNGRAALCKLSDDLWTLTIDSTIGAKDPYRPGPGYWFSDEKQDEILTWVKQTLNNGQELLVVMTHFPVEEFQSSLVPDEEDNFNARHIWVRGRELAKRIGSWRARNGSKTLWLSGDVHLPYRTSCYGIEFVTVGRLGTRTGRESQQAREAKLIEVFPTDTSTRISTFTYRMPGHSDRTAGGNWEVQTSTIAKDRANRRIKRVALSGRNTGESAFSPSGTPIVSSTPVETINADVEKRILATIAERKLYSVGRFETHEAIVSLSWVSVGPLLNTTGVLPGVLDAMHGWLTEKLSFPKNPKAFEQTVFLGIDCWGAVLASQLSVLTGALNFCVASRGAGLHYTTHERISDTVVKAVKKRRYVVLVHDVVGTGQSLKLIRDELTTKLRADAKRKEWLALSVIADRSRDRSATCSFLAAHGSACASLPMPILPKEQLPDQRILPPLLNFRVSSLM